MFLCTYVQKLQSYIEQRHRYLQSWAFREVSTPSVASTLEKLIDCLRTLYEQVTCQILYIYIYILLAIMRQYITTRIASDFAFTTYEGEFWMRNYEDCHEYLSWLHPVCIWSSVHLRCAFPVQ